MRVYVLKDFYKEAKKKAINDDDLCSAVKRAEDRLIDVKLGKFLIKQRIARQGQGKSKGFRATVFYKSKNVAVFLHVFAKSTQANLTDEELAAFRDLVAELDKLGEEKRAELVRKKKWIELDYEKYQEELSKRAASVDSPGGERPPRGRRGR